MFSAELERSLFPCLMLSLRISHQPTCLTLGSYKACSFTRTSLRWTGRFRSMGQHLQKQSPCQFEWHYFFLAQEMVFSLPPVSNPWLGDPGFVLEEGHTSLQLKYRFQVKAASLAEPQALPKLKQDVLIALHSSPWGHLWWLSWVRVCLVFSKFGLLSAGMDLLCLHPWPCVILTPPFHPIQLLWARSVMGKPVHKW